MGIRYWVLGWVDDWMNDGRYRMQNGMNVEHRTSNIECLTREKMTIEYRMRKRDHEASVSS